MKICIIFYVQPFMLNKTVFEGAFELKFSLVYHECTSHTATHGAFCVKVFYKSFSKKRIDPFFKFKNNQYSNYHMLMAYFILQAAKLLSPNVPSNSA